MNVPADLDLNGVDVVRACATACFMSVNDIDNVVPASPQQVSRMHHHTHTNSYMMQVVAYYSVQEDFGLLKKAWGALVAKNEILRTRLVKYRGLVLQVILKDTSFRSLPIWREESGLADFLYRDRLSKMEWGAPLFRYAIVRQGTDSFFLWTAHHSALDAWTIGLIWGDLEDACHDLEEYQKRPDRPPYRKYIEWLKTVDQDRSNTFWSKQQASQYNLDTIYANKEIDSLRTASTVRDTHPKLLHLHLEKLPDPSALYVMGHVAWALALATTSQTSTISFLSANPARDSTLPSVRSIMGPISALTPLLLQFSPYLPTAIYMDAIRTQFASMTGIEHLGLHAHKDHSTSTQSVLNWNPPGTDIFSTDTNSSRQIPCRSRDDPIACLDLRPALSTPCAHGYGLLVDIHEHRDSEGRWAHISIESSWDSDAVSKARVGEVVGLFREYMKRIVDSGGGVTVGEMVPALGRNGGPSGEGVSREPAWTVGLGKAGGRGEHRDV